MSKSKIILVISALFALMLIANVYAITGSIQGGRMIITAQTGESVERSIVVRNVNDADVDINLTVSGDLVDNVVLNEDAFTLEPDEEKRVYFTIEADEFGESETRINVKFTPSEGNGVILSAVITFVASGENVDNSGDVNNDNTEITDGNSSGDSLSFGVNSGTPEDERGSGLNLSPIILLSISTGILIIILILLIIYASKKKPRVDNVQKANKSDLKKGSRRTRE